MPEYIISTDEIKLLYTQLNNETENFRNLAPEILISNPKKIIVLRLTIGLSQNEFERLIGKQSKNIAKYETGKIKSMQISTAKNIIEKIKPSIKPISFENLIENFTKLRDESNGWFKANSENADVLEARRKGAIESLRKRRTPQEKTLEDELKRKNLRFYVNFPLSRNVIVDFYLPQRNIVVECKEIISDSRRETKEQIQKLAYQGYRIKFKFPKKETWCLIKTKLSLQNFEKEELQGPFDIVFNDIQNLIKNL